MIAGEARSIFEALLMLFAVDGADPASFERQAECMAQNIWFEARGSAFAEKLAVAQVVMNRVEATQHADTPCKVIWEDRQFSWTHDGLSDSVRIDNAVDRRGWTDSVLAALVATTPRLPDLTHGSTHFHAMSIAPDWSDEMQPVATYGGHIYYTRETESDRENSAGQPQTAAASMLVHPQTQVSADAGLHVFWNMIGLVAGADDEWPAPQVAPQVHDLVPLPSD